MASNHGEGRISRVRVGLFLEYRIEGVDHDGEILAREKKINVNNAVRSGKGHSLGKLTGKSRQVRVKVLRVLRTVQACVAFAMYVLCKCMYGGYCVGMQSVGLLMECTVVSIAGSLTIKPKAESRKRKAESRLDFVVKTTSRLGYCVC